MVILAEIISLLENTWFLALDMKDACFLVHIYQSHRRFHRFMIRQEHYQFRVLPFGLATAPRVFTKVLSVVVAEYDTL